MIEHWHEPSHAGEVNLTLQIADVVIEAFGCELPPVYVAAMARARAQAGVDQPRISERGGLGRGFSSAAVAASALSAREDVLLPRTRSGNRRRAERARTRCRARSPSIATRWWRERVGVAAPSRGTAPSFRCSPTRIPPSTGLLAQWRDASSPVVLLVPEGRISGAVARFLGVPHFAAGAIGGRVDRCARTRSASSSSRVSTRCSGPPTSTSCAARIRSCARSGRKSRSSGTSTRNPTTRICPKLDAALAHYANGLPDAARESVARFWHAWNGAGTPDWADFWRHRALLEARAADWATELAAVGDLAGNLAAASPGTARRTGRSAKTQLK